MLSQNVQTQCYTAVKTTGIYCLPSCTARAPKTENIQYYSSVKEAEAAGYRPCKKCFPNLTEVKWYDYKKHIEIETPEDFRFDECLAYMNRSDLECLHKVRGQTVYKLLKFDDIYCMAEIYMVHSRLRIDFLDKAPIKWVRAQAAKYVWDMFDLNTDMAPFYQLAAGDSLLKPLVEKYKGLRIVKINDLFESLTWAVMGQQINLRFAYTLKKRLVEKYGESIEYNGISFYLFPTPQVLADVEALDLQAMQFTKRKAEYIIGIAREFASGAIQKNRLLSEGNYEEWKTKLTSLRGVGDWTADYSILKSSDSKKALLEGDAGLQNALKKSLNLVNKPTIEEIKKLASGWSGWESYATFYLWRSLYG